MMEWAAHLLLAVALQERCKEQKNISLYQLESQVTIAG